MCRLLTRCGWVKVVDSRAPLVVQVIAKPPFWKGPAQPTLEDDAKESAAK